MKSIRILRVLSGWATSRRGPSPPGRLTHAPIRPMALITGAAATVTARKKIKLGFPTREKIFSPKTSRIINQKIATCDHEPGLKWRFSNPRGIFLLGAVPEKAVESG